MIDPNQKECLDDKRLNEHYNQLLRNAPNPGSLWQHYKGGFYLICGCSLQEDTLELLVTYQNQLGTCFTRKLSNWQETVSYEGQERKRFTEIHYETAGPYHQVQPVSAGNAAALQRISLPEDECSDENPDPAVDQKEIQG